MTEKIEIPDSKIHVMTRGEPVVVGEALLKMWDEVNTGKTRLCDLPDIFKKIREIKWNYSGSFYGVTFRVDTPIDIIDFGFYGPYKDEKTHYSVHIELYEPRRKEIMPNCTSSRIGRRKMEIDVEPNDNFYIGFEKPVSIKPKTWYLLQFKIDGPETKRCEGTTQDPIMVDIGNTKVKFEFTKDSQQMPSIRFMLPDGQQN